MQILKRKEIRAAIGKKGMFSDFPNLIDKLFYHSGITGFDMNQAKPMQGELVSFIGHPKGIEIRLNSTGQSVALPYSSILFYEIRVQDKQYSLVTFYLSSQETVIFKLETFAENQVIEYLKKTPVSENFSMNR